MKQWDIWTCDFAETGPHPAIIVSHPDRVARAPLVNVLIGSSQKAGRPARENEVLAAFSRKPLLIQIFGSHAHHGRRDLPVSIDPSLHRIIAASTPFTPFTPWGRTFDASAATRARINSRP